MIRRDLPLASGETAWALIPQIEHARLSGQIARRVVSLPGDPDDCRQTVAAIDQHDDGWAYYDALPRLDGEGRPRSFMEMDHDDSLAIWTHSIDRTAEIGPLAGWVVAGHFSRLLGSSEELGEATPAGRWQAAIARRREQWFSDWGGSAETAAAALDWLRVLDAASLWICACPAEGDRDEPARNAYETPTPAGSDLEWQSVAPGKLAVATHLVRPGPLLLEAAGSVVPAARYETSSELLAAATPRLFRWELLVAG